MTLRIYEPENKTEKEKEKEVFLRLKDVDSGIIRLVACHENGEEMYNGNILDISLKEGVHLCTGLGVSSGLPIDTNFDRIATY